MLINLEISRNKLGINKQNMTYLGDGLKRLINLECLN